MFKKLSLLKQLLILLLAIVLVIIFVVSPLINKNLNRLVSNQMYDLIDSSQNSYLNDFYNPVDSGDSRQVYHIYVDVSNSKISWQSVLPLSQNVANNLMVNVFSYDLINQKEDTGYYRINSDSEGMYYKIQRIENSGYLVSFIYGDYSLELIQSILNELVYVQYIVLFIVALVMVIWVGTLIKPLYQIENYINKIKHGEKGKLNIKRKDEIGKVSTALIEMEIELEKQESLKEELMHNISHDLKTPIAVIKSYSESMKDDIYPYGTKESSLDVILENANRLEDKVKSFLYLNRLDYLKQDEIELEEINMIQLITKVKEQLDVNNNLIDINLLDDEVYFLGQEEHWRNVVENIIENAKRYCHQKILITLGKDMLAIYNDGPEIEDELIKTIFNPFTKGEKGNFGLGLSIVKKVVDMFGYQIMVENINNGVQFKIYK
ncbi:MAG: HAMP domain-containing histidine kinase [Erysipelotrichaceae bacterium]|nr:HAMP domain-containing histidine kinase [Erysipelotrichaceae bacterium]